MSKIEVDAIDKQSGSTLTLGGSGTAVTLACGATQSGFGRSGSVNWQTTPKTATFTAVNGEGYFINQGSQITANLPAGSAGAIVAFSDYARNFATYNLIISPNGSEKIGGIAQDAKLTVDGQAATFVYVDSTKGWVNVQNAEDTETGNPPFIGATGGAITESGNCRIHTFTGPGTFTVNRIATCCAAVNNLVSYLVIAGGGGGGGYYAGGGGGAGGYREVVSPGSPYTGSPTQGYSTPGNRITVTATAYPIQIGGGGPAGGATGPSGANNGTQGGTTTFSTISSAGGGFGVGHCGGGTQPTGGSGGSGGGGTGNCGPSNGGAGNTPPVTPAQGSNGGNAQSSSGDRGGGGGGGATAVGQAGQPSPGTGGAGGAGATSSINATPTARAGGGGGGSGQSPVSPAPVDGGGKGGLGSPPAPGAPGTAATDNTGGGGGGAGGSGPSTGGNGGSGIVIIRYKFQ
jgi:hypothetical protein